MAATFTFGTAALLTAGEHTLRMLPPLVMERDDLVRGLSIIENIIAQ